MDELSFHVRYAETDQMGRAYYAWYLVWFEAGRSNLMRNMGMSYAELEKQGIFLPVRSVSARYEKPVHYDEKITVRTWIKHYTPARAVFASCVLTESGETACSGEVELAVTNSAGEVSRWPKKIMEILKTLQGESEESRTP